MQGDRFKVGVAGASSLLGKELSEEMSGAAFAAAEIVLLDEESAEGQIASAGDEATVVQRLETGAFAGMAMVFFAGAPEMTRAFWQEARGAGALVVDATYALSNEAEALLWSPWVQGSTAERGERQPDLMTSTVVVVHPVALLLAHVAQGLRRAGMAATSVVATLLQPASEQGRAGLDELHQQTVHLLRFQELPKETYDAQTAFNLLPAFGEEAKARLEATRATVAEHYQRVAGEGAPQLRLQVVQAPVFHGFALSAYVEGERPMELEAVKKAAASALVTVVGEGDEPPSNLAVAGQTQALLQVSQGAGESGVWLWMTADNLKLLAAEAVSTALALRRMQPHGKVQ